MLTCIQLLHSPYVPDPSPKSASHLFLRFDQMFLTRINIRIKQILWVASSKSVARNMFVSFHSHWLGMLVQEWNLNIVLHRLMEYADWT